MTNNIALKLSNVCKHYEKFQLNNVNLYLNQGDALGLVGPSGAGKSTILRLIMGLISPDAGQVEVLGYKIPEQQVMAKYNIGFVSDDMHLYGSQTIAYHMNFIRSIFPTWDNTYALHLLALFDLQKDQIVQGLSHGQRIKLSLLLALARRPKLLVFDEPTTGLDPAIRIELLDEIIEVLKDKLTSIIFSSHNTLDIEKVSDHISFIYEGKIVEAASKKHFLSKWRRINFKRFDLNTLNNLLEIVDITTSADCCSVLVKDYSANIYEKLLSAGANINEVKTLTLEEIFVANIQYLKGKN